LKHLLIISKSKDCNHLETNELRCILEKYTETIPKDWMINRLGNLNPIIKRNQSARVGLASSTSHIDDSKLHFRQSIINSTADQLLETYGAATIEAWRDDLDFIKEELLRNSFEFVINFIRKTSGYQNSLLPQMSEILYESLKERRGEIVLKLFDILKKLVINWGNNERENFKYKHKTLMEIKLLCAFFKIEMQEFTSCCIEYILNSGLESLQGSSPIENIYRFKLLISLFLEISKDQNLDIKPSENFLGQRLLFTEFNAKTPKQFYYLIEIPMHFNLQNVIAEKKLFFMTRFNLNEILIFKLKEKLNVGDFSVISSFCDIYKNYIVPPQQQPYHN